MMQRLFTVVFLIVLFSSCGSKNEAEKGKSPGINVDWITGSWIRINDEGESQTYEVWEKVSEDVYQGKGWTMQDSDTVFQEDLKIAKTDTIWNLEVTGVNEENTLFRITETSEGSFTAENEQNEFPKKIQYILKNKHLEAVISDDENEVLFVFERDPKN